MIEAKIKQNWNAIEEAINEKGKKNKIKFNLIRSHAI